MTHLRLGPAMVARRQEEDEAEQTYVLESEHLALATRLAEAERLLRGVSERHEYQAGLGPCICAWHEDIRKFLRTAHREDASHG